MTKSLLYLYLAFFVPLAAGCVSANRAIPTHTSVKPTSKSATAKITLAEFQETSDLEPLQPPTVVNSPHEAVEHGLPQSLPPTDGLNLEALEQMALTANPAIAQAAARVRALRGKRLQVGLKPNPTVGYVAGEVGNDGAAGQQGAFVGQDFITANKLQRNRAVVAAEISRAEQQLAAMERRVRTDVRQSYYEALLAQRRVELANNLVRVTSDAVDTSKSLVDAEELALAGLLQTEVRQQNAEIVLRTSRNRLEQAWRRLSAIVGGPELPVQSIAGDVTNLPGSLVWEEQLARLQTQSPEIAVAMAQVERARRALNRACVEAVPNISTQVSVQYDDATEDTIAGVQIGVPIPIWNRNQGGIQQAQAEITEAVQNVERVERSLNRRLAEAFRRYSDAQVTAENYANDILPRAQRTFELVQMGFKQGEVGYLDLLAAQQTYSQTNLAYLDALSLLWKSYVEIDGLLLTGSLDTPSN